MADQGEWVEFPGPGGTFKAFVARPDLPSPWPTLICIHAASGLDAHHQNVTRGFAAQGYFTVSPNIYSPDPNYLTFKLEDIEDGMIIGTRIKDVPAYLATFPESRRAEILRAHHWMEARPQKGFIHVIAACHAWLKSRRDVGAIGVIGYCMGGRLVAELAVSGAELAAGVIYYGIDPGVANVAKIRCPLLGHYGATDRHITDRVPGWAGALKAAGKDFTYHIYEAGHGFGNGPHLSAYNDAAAKLAHARTYEFLAKHLKKVAVAAE